MRRMFDKLSDYKYRRTTSQAIGFYVAYLILIVIVGALAGAVVGPMVSSVDPYNSGVRVGVVTAIVISTLLSYSVASQKRLTKNTKFLLLVLSSGVLAFLGGGLLGLIPTAYLTTVKGK